MVIEMNIENLEHIKKYREVLTLYKDVMEDMSEYFKNNKKLSGKMLEEMQDLASKETLFDHDLYFDDAVKSDVLMDALFFRNYKKFTSLVDIFLKENKYKNESDKKFMLEALANSKTELFRIIKTDKNNGYVYLENVNTKKSITIIDIAMSNSLSCLNTTNKKLFLFSRVFYFNDVPYLTDMKLTFSSDNKMLKGFLDKIKKKKISNLGVLFNLCIIYDKSDDVEVTISNV